MPSGTGASAGQASESPSQESSASLLTKILLMIPGVVADSPLSAMPKLMISEARNFPDLAQFYLQEVIRRGHKLLTAIIARGVERGEFLPVAEILRRAQTEPYTPDGIYVLRRHLHVTD